MPTIADGVTTLTFIRLSRPAMPIGERVKDITRPNVDGHAFRKIGKRAPPSEFVSLVDVATLAGVQTVMQSYAAMQGAVVTVTDDLANVWADAVVLAVEVTEAAAVAGAVGGLNAPSVAIVRARWTILLAA